jgi:hypothetical protein
MAWRVIYSGKIRRDFVALCMSEAAQGRLKPILVAMEDLHGRLAANPLEVGEPHNRLKHMGLTLCTAFRKPLTVRFAVDERRKLVYMRNISYQP